MYIYPKCTLFMQCLHSVHICAEIILHTNTYWLSALAQSKYSVYTLLYCISYTIPIHIVYIVYTFYCIVNTPAPCNIFMNSLNEVSTSTI